MQNPPIAFQESWRKPQVRKGGLEASAGGLKGLINGLSLLGGQGLCIAMERGGRLGGRNSSGLALEELIPADEVGKGRPGEAVMKAKRAGMEHESGDRTPSCFILLSMNSAEWEI